MRHREVKHLSEDPQRKLEVLRRHCVREGAMWAGWAGVYFVLL